MNQNLLNILAIISVIAMGVGLGLPGVVKWRTEEFSGWDAAVMAAGAITLAYGIVCGARYAYQSYVKSA